MKTILKNNLLILAPETEDEAVQLASWKQEHQHDVLALARNSGTGVVLQIKGPSVDVCRQPVNVSMKHREPGMRLISNLAQTPFVFDDVEYASLDAFLQNRTSIDDRQCQLMYMACYAKFAQNADACEALLSTNKRPLVCADMLDSESVLPTLVADCWMRVRKQLSQTAPDRVERFDGRFRWLSNFHPANVVLDGDQYATVEHAYQAAKSTDTHVRQRIRNAETPGEAKRLGSEIVVRDDWDQLKRVIMENLLRQKFQDLKLRQALIETAAAELIEGNTWGDCFWGICNGQGENWLGRLLMTIRDELRDGWNTTGLLSRTLPGGSCADRVRNSTS